MTGFVQINRSIWDNPDFQDTEMSQREAFMWMIAHAAWRPTRSRVGKAVVNVQRGQLAFSVRFLADKFGWSKSRVQRFLEALKNRDSIETNSGTGVNVITICNYDKYQLTPKDSGTAAGHDPGQQRDSSGTKKNTGNITLPDGDARETEIAMVRRRCLEAAGLDENILAGKPNLVAPTDIIHLMRPASGAPCDLELDILPAIQRGAAQLASTGQSLNSWRYFREAAIRNRDQRLAPAPAVQQRPANAGSGGPSNPALAALVSIQAASRGEDHDREVQDDAAFTIDHEELAPARYG